MSPQRHITQIFLCSATEHITQCVLAINVSCPFRNILAKAARNVLTDKPTDKQNHQAG